MPFALLLALPLLAAVPDAAPVCPATPAQLPAVLAGWTSAAPVTAAADATSVARATLPLGKRADASLVAGARFVAAPAKAPAPGTFGGMLGFTISAAGTYRVALGTAAWIDVLREGKPVTSTAHDHGPTCSGIRKMVDFALTPGRYVLQVSGSTDAVAAVLVTPLP